MAGDEESTIQQQQSNLAGIGKRIFKYTEKEDAEDAQIGKELEATEWLLYQMRQTPPADVRIALESIAKALVRQRLLHHRLKNVRLSVLSCLTEIFRISAPNPPFKDAKLAKIFAETIPFLEELASMNSINKKRVSILSNLAAVGAFSLLLDLRLPKLVLRLVESLLSSLDSNSRLRHCTEAMEAIEATLIDVLENADELTGDLLEIILRFSKKNSADECLHAQKMIVKVVSQCSKVLESRIVPSIISHAFRHYNDAVSAIFKPQMEIISLVNDITKELTFQALPEDESGKKALVLTVKKRDKEVEIRKKEEADMMRIKALVDRWIRVWRPEKERQETGLVTAFSVESGKHTLLFDNGEVAELDLSKEEWEFKYFA